MPAVNATFISAVLCVLFATTVPAAAGIRPRDAA